MYIVLGIVIMLLLIVTFHYITNRKKIMKELAKVEKQNGIRSKKGNKRGEKYE